MREDTARHCLVVRACVTFVTLCAFSVAASAELKPEHPTPSERKMLPPYCAARDIKAGGGDPAAYRSWEQMMGVDNFEHVHHYCRGLTKMRRAQFESDRNARIHYLQGAINEFDYVLRSWKPDFKLAISARRYRLQAESELKRVR